MATTKRETLTIRKARLALVELMEVAWVEETRLRKGLSHEEDRGQATQLQEASSRSCSKTQLGPEDLLNLKTTLKA